MRRIIAILLISVMLIPLMASGGTEKASADGTYPAGDIVFWGTGQPGYRQPYYQWYAMPNDVRCGCAVPVEYPDILGIPLK